MQSWRFLFLSLRYPHILFLHLDIFVHEYGAARALTGVFSALLLRFDAMRANADPADGEHGKFPKVSKAPSRRHQQQQPKRLAHPPDVKEGSYVSPLEHGFRGDGGRLEGKTAL